METPDPNAARDKDMRETAQKHFGHLSPELKSAASEELGFMQKQLRLFIDQYEQKEARLPGPTPAEVVMLQVLQGPHYTNLRKMLQIQTMIYGLSEIIGIVQQGRNYLNEGRGQA